MESPTMSRAASLFLITLGLFSMSPAAPAEETKPKPLDEKALTKAQLKEFNQRRDEALQAAFDQFPVIEVTPRGAEKPKIHTIEMNRKPVIVDGWRYDGFRFRVDRGKDPELQKNLSFVWGLVGFPELKSWYIVPRSGEMKGFTYFMNESKSKLRRIRDTAGPQEARFYSQSLSASSLLEGGEYLIHIRFRDDSPKNVTFVATLADESGDLLGPLGCEEIKGN